MKKKMEKERKKSSNLRCTGCRGNDKGMEKADAALHAVAGKAFCALVDSFDATSILYFCDIMRKRAPFNLNDCWFALRDQPSHRVRKRAKRFA